MVAEDVNAMPVEEEEDLEMERATALSASDPAQAEPLLRTIIFEGAAEHEGGRSSKTREEAIYLLLECLVQLK